MAASDAVVDTAADSSSSSKSSSLIGIVPTTVMVAMITFYDTEGLVIGHLHDLLMRRIFAASDVPFQIQYTTFGGGHNKQQPQHPPSSPPLIENDSTKLPYLFNQPTFCKKLEEMFVRALAYLDVSKVVVFWYVRDVAVWMRQVLLHIQAQRDEATFPMPFGVLEADAYELELHQRLATTTRSSARTPEIDIRIRLLADSSSDNSSTQKKSSSPLRFPHYEYVAYTEHFHSVPLSPILLQRANEYLRDIGQLAATASSSQQQQQQNTHMPRTPFFDLMDEYNYMQEARRNLRDADWRRSHPRVYVQSQPPQTGGVQIDPMDISNANLYSQDSIFDASHAMMSARANYTLDDAERLLNRIRVMSGGPGAAVGRFAGGGGGGKTIRQLERERFGRPDDLEDIHMFPEIMRFVQAPEAVVLDNAERAETRYAMLAASLVGVPVAFLSGHGLLGSTLQFNRDTTSIDMLQQTVERRRHSVQRMFATLYKHAFGAYDMEQLNETASLFEQTIVEQQTAAPTASSEEEVAETTLAATLSPANTTLRAVREYMQTLRQQNVSRLTLVFPREPTQRDIAKLDYLTKLFFAGAVPLDEQERAVRDVYGTTVRLQALPTAPPGTTNSSKKRGRKAVRGQEEEEEEEKERDQGTGGVGAKRRRTDQ